VFGHDLHVMLALASLAGMAVVAGEGAVRLIRSRPPGRAASAAFNVVLVLLGMAAANGLALLLGGHRPREWLHLLYVVLAFALVPLADAVTAHAAPRRRAATRLAGALVAIGVIVRLFATG
jgi:hypothetical protein